MTKNNQVFYKKVHMKTQSIKKDILVIFKFQEAKNFNLFDINCTSRERQMSYST